MRILSVTAQKPDSTGSGVYLTELVKGFDALGCQQAVVCGTVREDTLAFPEQIALFPVYYHSEAVPFPVCGMSDEMPYESTRYRDLNDTMTRQLLSAFRTKLAEAVKTFHPDVILCHHLYFLTALVRQMYPNIPVWGQCHGSDLRQLATNPWLWDWIKGEIPRLDGILALHQAQKDQICQVFRISEEKVHVMGTGYNSSVFFVDAAAKAARHDSRTRFIFAGKLSEKKGVYSLLRCLERLKKPETVELWLAGGCGSEKELENLRILTAAAPCEVRLLGKLDQKTLARRMNESDVFILPSFYEGLPLVLIEAMACGLKTICTDLPGIQPWLERAIPENGTIFVKPPRMEHSDEPVPAELPDFEERLARAMEKDVSAAPADRELVRQVSWDALCRKLTALWK